MVHGGRRSGRGIEQRCSAAVQKHVQSAFGLHHGGARASAREVPPSKRAQIPERLGSTKAPASGTRLGEQVEVMSHEPNHPGSNETVEQVGTRRRVAPESYRFPDVVQQRRGVERAIVRFRAGVVEDLELVEQDVPFRVPVRRVDDRLGGL